MTVVATHAASKSSELRLASAAFAMGGRARLFQIRHRDQMGLLMALVAGPVPDDLRRAIEAFLRAGQTAEAGVKLQDDVRGWLADRAPADLFDWTSRKDCGHD